MILWNLSIAVFRDSNLLVDCILQFVFWWKKTLKFDKEYYLRSKIIITATNGVVRTRIERNSNFSKYLKILKKFMKIFIRPVVTIGICAVLWNRDIIGILEIFIFILTKLSFKNLNFNLDFGRKLLLVNILTRRETQIF